MRAHLLCRISFAASRQNKKVPTTLVSNTRRAETTVVVMTWFIDAIPAIIVLGTVLLPLADKVGMHPIHFAVIGVISLAFGLVTPPYGLCLLISCSLGEVQVVNVLKDVGIILVPMLILLVIVIVFPEFVLFLPRLITPKFL